MAVNKQEEGCHSANNILYCQVHYWALFQHCGARAHRGLVYFVLLHTIICHTSSTGQNLAFKLLSL